MASTVKWRMPTRDEAARLGLDADQYADLAAAAVVRIEDTKHPLSGNPTQVAQVAGLTLAAARKRATDRSLHPSEPRRVETFHAILRPGEEETATRVLTDAGFKVKPT